MEKKFIRKCGSSCIVKDCKSSKRLNPNCKLFKFPCRNVPLFKTWLNNLNLSEKDVRHSSFVCDAHFNKNSIGKKFLITGAVPIHINVDTVDEPNEHDMVINKYANQKTYLGPRSRNETIQSDLRLEEFEVFSKHMDITTSFDIQDKDVNITSFCSHCLKNEENLQYYVKKSKADANALKCARKRLQSKIKIIKNYAVIIKRLRKKVMIKNNVSLDSLIEEQPISPESKVFAKMLLIKNVKYTSEQRAIALSIQYKSNATYNLMRNILKFNLPAKSTICRWAPLQHMNPGFNNSIIEKLKQISDALSNEAKEAVLIFDAIHIRSDLKYNQKLDELTGFVDLGKWGKESQLGKEIVVFMIRGLYAKWKYVLSYIVCHNALEAKTLIEVLKANINMCELLGFSIRAITCDQGSGNRSCYAKLGVTIQTPYFEYEKKKIYALYDVPHLFKSVRNTLLNYNIEHEAGTSKIDVIRRLYNIDCTSTTRICPRLTRKHLYPTCFEKMKVSRAVQLLSNSCAAGLLTALNRGLFDESMSKYAKPTAIFFKECNDAFDALNSKYGPSNIRNDSVKQSLQKANCAYTKLKEFLVFLKTIKIQSKTNRAATTYCFDGLIQTINGVLSLAEECFKQGYSHLKTAHLNQDPLENFFSQVRARNGNSINPSVYEFNFIVARLEGIKLLSDSTLSNCEVDDLDNLLHSESYKPTLNETASNGLHEIVNINFDEIEATDSDEMKYIDNIDDFDIENVEDINTSTTYFVGYVIFKMLPKMNCSLCEQFCIKATNEAYVDSECLINYKAYENFYFVKPSEAFLKICAFHIEMFGRFFKKTPQVTNIKEKIINVCLNEMQNIDDYKNYFNEECGLHRKMLLEFLILILIRKNCTWRVEEINREEYIRKLTNKKNKMKGIGSNNKSKAFPVARRTNNRKMKILASNR